MAGKEEARELTVALAVDAPVVGRHHAVLLQLPVAPPCSGASWATLRLPIRLLMVTFACMIQ